MASVAAFYDGLAEHYHLAYEDWTEAVQRHGRTLASLLHRYGVPSGCVLDCACGIGTQAIGLALEGYAVTGSDVSPQAIERLTREAARFSVAIPAYVADFRVLETQISGTFDAVICCDNSLPHLLSDRDIEQALRSMLGRLRPDGVLVIGVRDYDTITSDPPIITPPRLIDRGDERSIVFQYWEWTADGSSYELHFFVHTWQDGQWHTTTVSTTYRALRRADLEALLRIVGVTVFSWHEPDGTGHHQPLLVARHPLTA